MVIPLEPITSRSVTDTTPNHLNPIHWHQSLGLARQICARVFRDGGTAADAVAAFGLEPRAELTWDKAVEVIAEALARAPSRRAA